MQRTVEHALEECDAVLFVLNAEQGVGPGDRFIASALDGASIPVVAAVNKVDRLDRARTAAALQATADLEAADEIFPVSALRGTGVRPLVEHLVSLLPEGPFYFPPEERTDQPENVLLAELVREQVLARTRQEVPHAVEVIIEEIEPRRDDLTVVTASIWVEAESQKGILIGAGGRTIKAIGTAARRELERELGTQVHLDLAVRVRRRWRTDESLLDRLGIE
jgi:GTP-binding protein Era